MKTWKLLMQCITSKRGGNAKMLKSKDFFMCRSFKLHHEVSSKTIGRPFIIKKGSAFSWPKPTNIAMITRSNHTKQNNWAWAWNRAKATWTHRKTRHEGSGSQWFAKSKKKYSDLYLRITSRNTLFCSLAPLMIRVFQKKPLPLPLLLNFRCNSRLV